MTLKLATINIQVPDPGRSKRFYLDALGMVEDPRRSHPPGFVYLRSDGCDVTLATPPDGPSPGPGAGPSTSIELGFETDDLDAARAHLVALGVSGLREESMGWGRAIELRDLDGHRVLIYSFADDRGS